jgi:hypothetical protein
MEDQGWCFSMVRSVGRRRVYLSANRVALFNTKRHAKVRVPRLHSCSNVGQRIWNQRTCPCRHTKRRKSFASLGDGRIHLPLRIRPYSLQNSNLDRGYNPFSQVDAEGWEVTGKGQLGHIRFGGGDDYARKSLGDPDMVSHSWIHHFDPPGNVVRPFII